MQAKGQEGAGSSWVAVLQSGAYRDLSVEQRVAALCALCHAVMDGPAVRSAMDARLDEAHNRRRMHWEEIKARPMPAMLPYHWLYWSQQRTDFSTARTTSVMGSLPRVKHGSSVPCPVVPTIVPYWVPIQCSFACCFVEACVARGRAAGDVYAMCCAGRQQEETAK